MRTQLGVFAVFLAVAGCNKTGEQPQSDNSLPQGGMGHVNIILNATALRLAPTDEEAVPHPQAGPSVMVENMVGHLYRSLHCKVLRVVPGWSFIKLPDDAEGWVHSNDLVFADGIAEATVLEPTPAYQANHTQANLAAVVQPGSLLLVMERQGDMSKVHIESVGVAWIETSKLVHETQELGMAHLLIESKLYAHVNDSDELSEILDEARLKYPNSPLMGLVADQVNFSKYHANPVMDTSRMNLRPPSF